MHTNALVGPSMHSEEHAILITSRLSVCLSVSMSVTVSLYVYNRCVIPILCLIQGGGGDCMSTWGRELKWMREIYSNIEEYGVYTWREGWREGKRNRLHELWALDEIILWKIRLFVLNQCFSNSRFTNWRQWRVHCNIAILIFMVVLAFFNW